MSVCLPQEKLTGDTAEILVFFFLVFFSRIREAPFSSFPTNKHEFWSTYVVLETGQKVQCETGQKLTNLSENGQKKEDKNFDLARLESQIRGREVGQKKVAVM